jgi:uncharacterized protein (TIGR02001 family)
LQPRKSADSPRSRSNAASAPPPTSCAPAAAESSRARRSSAPPRAAARSTRLLIALLAAGAAAPACAQLTGGVGLESDFRLRGYSLSEGRPVATARLGYDDPSGLYADGSGTLAFGRGEEARFLGVQGAVGYARRLGNGWSVDVGAAHNQLSGAYYDYHYSEAYVGFSRSPVSAYVFVSPNYFRSGVVTIYGQVDGSLPLARNWLLSAHVGSLNVLDEPGQYGDRRSSYDWRLAIQREFRNVEAHVGVSGGGPGRQYYDGTTHSRTALTGGISASF